MLYNAAYTLYIFFIQLLKFLQKLSSITITPPRLMFGKLSSLIVHQRLRTDSPRRSVLYQQLPSSHMLFTPRGSGGSSLGEKAIADNWMAASRLKMNSDKSEVIWVGCRRTVSTHGCPAIRIGNDTICATNKARLLGMLKSIDLTFDQHASTSCVNSALSVSR